ncbi:2-amino-4-hydroxy-6-hydroxymethyldihydropteridine diphosphokinase [Roseospirillum parvum]|uniref:2-amino-4-hydroxy-6-hydroxymethyldihydropteridine pyrophosphokinase n=1 Tax=Roseospirillum parvum TaxID=83401 RepID=A0A1G7YLY2_9PROT|nr:2-amino-4-hydroxy-6-hydroxymethyldihydropteridine diphosphokinase [Roseospirillum parvum]SDG97538.1 2-amino-4-hydroxy-6-hydroxymethyldihydropteridinediphosphokinase [Roseospirillum parvum]
MTSASLTPDAASRRVLVGLGSNLPGRFASPLAVLEAALAALERAGLSVAARSGWWESAPVPRSDQPWFVNGVVRLAGGPPAVELLDLLNRIEADLGRHRDGTPNAPRVVDLDLLDDAGQVVDTPRLTLPHPRLAERAFVLHPLAEVAPGWTHPLSGRGLPELIAALPPDQEIRPLP